MNLKKYAVFFFLVFVVRLNAQDILSVKSPDKRLVLTVELNRGTPFYSIKYAGHYFLDKSPLGLISSVGSFTNHLRLVGTTVRTIRENYTLDRSKVNKVSYLAKELSYSLVNAADDSIRIVFSVGNHDVAFRYIIPSNGHPGSACTIDRELTGFHVPLRTTTFVTPQAPAQTGYEQSKPSYEEAYTHDAPLHIPSKYGLGYTFPALFHLGKEGWMLISETGNDGNYPGTRLSDIDSDGIYLIRFPQQKENNGVGSATASGILPMKSSWKTITVGLNLKPIVESTVSTDVVTPEIKSSNIFEPGSASWSWIVWQDASCNFDDQVSYINLAADLHCKYVLIDAGWDQKIGRQKMAELVAYARSKNVEVILWYNSNGNWNNTPQTPKNLMNTADARRNEMGWLQKIGVKGLKIDFFGGDKQVTMQLYHDILQDAAVYGLSVNFHGTTIPRGWERMYPNYMTSEAVLASENLVFQQGFADRYASTATIYPFTRNAIGPMDFGPVFLNSRLSRDEKTGTIRRTTDAFEIATSVIFFSAIQHWGLTPNNLTEKPNYLFDFIREVPTVWDETRFIDGYPGRYCVIARRKGEKWYLAAINGENTKLTLKLKLPMLKGRTVKMIGDGKGQGSVLKNLSVNRSGDVTISMSSYGGTVLYE